METIGSIQVVASINTKDYDKGKKYIEKGNDELEGSAKKTSSGFSAAWAGAIGGLVATVAQKGFGVISNSIDGTVKRVDTLNNSTRTFDNMGIATADSQKAMDALQKSIKGMPTPLDGAVRGMTALTATYGDIGKGQAVFSALNNAILGFGGSSAEVDNAIAQLSQLPMDGPLDAQTWNSLRNSGLTPLLTAMAKDSGMSVSQMKEAFGSGELTVRDFTDRLVKMNKDGGGGLKSLEKIAKDSTGGVSTGFENMQTAIVRGMGKVLDAVGSKNISSAITAIGDGFEKSLNVGASAIRSIMPVIGGFTSFVKDNSTVIIALGAAVVGTMATWKAYQLTMVAIGAIKAAVTAASIALSSVLAIQAQGVGIARAAWIALNLAMAANPIGLIIAVVGGLTAGLMALSLATDSNKGPTDRLKLAQDALKTSTDLLKQAEQSVADARLARTGSDIAVQRAEQRLTELKASGTASSLDLKEAEYNLAVAKDTAKKAAEEEKKAVDAAKAAKEDEKNKAAAVVTAQDNVNNAVRTTAGGYQLLADNISKAAEADRKTGKVGQGKNTTNAIFGINGTPFADGGFTGRGGKYEPAGVVHKGEYVVPKQYVNQSTGLPNMGGGTEYNIQNINISSEVDGDRWLRRLTNNTEIESSGLVPTQRYA